MGRGGWRGEVTSSRDAVRRRHRGGGLLRRRHRPGRGCVALLPPQRGRNAARGHCGDGVTGVELFFSFRKKVHTISRHFTLQCGLSLERRLSSSYGMRSSSRPVCPQCTEVEFTRRRNNSMCAQPRDRGYAKTFPESSTEARCPYSAAREVSEVSCTEGGATDRAPHRRLPQM